MAPCFVALLALLFLVSGLDALPGKHHMNRLELVRNLRSSYSGLPSKDVVGTTRDNGDNPDKIVDLIDNLEASDVPISELTASQLEDGIFQFASVALKESVPKKCRRYVISELFVAFLINRLQDSMDADLSNSFYGAVRRWARAEGNNLVVSANVLARRILNKYRPSIKKIKKLYQVFGVLEGQGYYFTKIVIYAENYMHSSTSLAEMLNNIWSFADVLEINQEGCRNYNKIKPVIEQIEGILYGTMVNHEDDKEFQSANNLTDTQMQQLRKLEDKWYNNVYGEMLCRLSYLTKNWSVPKFTKRFARDFADAYFGNVVQGIHKSTCFNDFKMFLAETFGKV